MKEYTIFWIKPDVYIPREERDNFDKLTKELPENPLEFINIVKDSLTKQGLELVAEKETTLTYELAEEHYEEHKNNVNPNFNERSFEWLIEFMISWKTYWMIFYWEDAIKKARKFLYEIREEYLVDRKVARRNMTHAADSIESANREIDLHFPELKWVFKNTII